jgi:hypothetical protein
MHPPLLMFGSRQLLPHSQAGVNHLARRKPGADISASIDAMQVDVFTSFMSETRRLLVRSSFFKLKSAVFGEEIRRKYLF